MAKDKVEVKKADGSINNPYIWQEPYPASELDKDGDETVFVKAVIGQDIILNGVKLNAGTIATLEAGFAHQHAAVLSTPK